MPQDGGWIQLVEPATRRISARGHLMVNEITAGGWRGRLESVRLDPLGAPLAAGNYIAVFGPWTEPHLVTLAEGAPDDAPRISSDDEPSVLRERSDGD